MPPRSELYQVALSFAGEQRPLVAAVADRLAESLGREQVFYDRFHEAELARPNLDVFLQEIYHDRSRLVVVFLCADYERKEWCGLEWRGVRDLIKRREEAKIMLVRIDDAEISGLLGIDGFIDARGRTSDEIAERILERLRLLDREPPGSPLSAEARSPRTPERRLQLALVGKVRSLWVKEELEPVVPIELGREERPLEAALAIPLVEGGRPTDLHRPVLDVFLERDGGEERERSLLIRGDPGSGKSRTLRQLFVDLAERAQRDPTRPIPVLFNLASWSRHGGRLDAWLAEQLGTGFYGVAPKLAAEWIAGDRVLPLLDGLDEVGPESRPACVAAINAFLRGGHGLLGMAVCCRNSVLLALPEPLQLEVEIALQPLTAGQIEASLAAAGAGGEPVRTLLAGDAGWRDLARSPLLLDLLQKTFRAAPAEARAETTAVLAGAGDRRRRIFSGYVATMLTRKGETPRYSPEATRSALAWLAGWMQADGLAFFRIEQLEPCWLPGQAGRLAYAVLSRIAVACLLVLPLAFRWTPAFLLLGVVGGALVGATDALRLRRGQTGSAESPTGWGRAVARVALIGAEAFLPCLLLGWLWLRGRPEDPGLRDDLPWLLSVALLSALLFGLVFGLRGAGRDGGSDIRIGPGLRWSRWSWRGTCHGALWGGGGTLAVFAARWLSVTRAGAADDLAAMTLWLFLLPLVALVGGVLGGVLGGLEPLPLDTRIGPNRGVWLSLRNAGLIGLLVLLVTALGLGGLLWAFEGVRRQLTPQDPPLASPFALSVGPPILGLTLALWVALWASGMDFLAHFTLRLLLALRTPLPLRCARFLDHAAGHGLLRRNGGTYAFYHGLLQEYFAAQRGRQEPSLPPAT